MLSKPRTVAANASVGSFLHGFTPASPLQARRFVAI
jgi:hypothetical protein